VQHHRNFCNAMPPGNASGCFNIYNGVHKLKGKEWTAYPMAFAWSFIRVEQQCVYFAKHRHKIIRFRQLR
jgi:hypothetical protein